MLKVDNELKNIPVLAVKEFAMGSDKGKFLEASLDGYIDKLISVSNFLETVERFINRLKT